MTFHIYIYFKIKTFQAHRWPKESQRLDRYRYLRKNERRCIRKCSIENSRKELKEWVQQVLKKWMLFQQHHAPDSSLQAQRPRVGPTAKETPANQSWRPMGQGLMSNLTEFLSLTTLKCKKEKGKNKNDGVVHWTVIPLSTKDICSHFWAMRNMPHRVKNKGLYGRKMFPY